MFFNVMWRGICQVMGWFFGLFGYKRDGRFARCVWGVFSISGTVVMAFMAGCVLYLGYDHFARQYRNAQYLAKTGGQYVSPTIGYVTDYDGEDGYLIDKNTGKKVLKGVKWIARSQDGDTLVCFSNGSKRGYFDMKNGSVVIKPEYDHAWIFSEGLAAVEENGTIKFIDGTGKVVIDNGMAHDYSTDAYVFHNGYLVMHTKDDKYGMMDKTGKIILEVEYDYINNASKEGFLAARKDGQTTVYDTDMNVVIPDIDGCVFFTAETIDVTMDDHTMRKYDYAGNLINDFYISGTHNLTYDTDEIYYTRDSYVNDDGEEQEYLTEQNKQAVARLRSYESGCHHGLMTAEGHIVTMPLYEEIEAIGPDTYLCTVSNGDKVIVNGKGQVVR